MEAGNGANKYIDPKALQEVGAKAMTIIQEHFQSLSTMQVKKQELQPGDCSKLFPAEIPIEGCSMESLLEEMKTKIYPNACHWQHPQFFAYYPASTSTPAILSEALVASIGSVGLQWVSNPIATELEVLVMDWMCKMIGVGGDFLHTSGKGGGIIQGVAGEAILNIVSCAKYKKIKEITHGDSDAKITEDERNEIFFSELIPKLVVYMSDDSHFCIPKACRINGVRFRKLPTTIQEDGNYGLSASTVEDAIAEDTKIGRIPCAVILNYGTTNTCGYDPLATGYAELVEKHNIWLHVDAAYAGPSLILPEFQEKISKPLRDIATSFNFNGSKWFLCGFDSAFLYCRDKKLLIQTNAITGDYMHQVEEDDGSNITDPAKVYAPEFKDWSIPLGRRFRALRVYMVLSHFGLSGMQKFIRQGVASGDYLRDAFAKHPDKFKFPVKNDLGLVCFQVVNAQGEPDKERTTGLAVYLRSKNFFLYPSVLKGESIIRIASGGVFTEQKHLDGLVEETLKYVNSSADEGKSN